MSTKKTTKQEVLEVLELFNKLYAGLPWFYGAYAAVDDLGQHIDLHVDIEAMKAEGYTIPGAPLGVKTCIFNGKRSKAVV